MPWLAGEEARWAESGCRHQESEAQTKILRLVVYCLDTTVCYMPLLISTFKVLFGTQIWRARSMTSNSYNRPLIYFLNRATVMEVSENRDMLI